MREHARQRSQSRNLDEPALIPLGLLVCPANQPQAGTSTTSGLCVQTKQGKTKQNKTRRNTAQHNITSNGRQSGQLEWSQCWQAAAVCSLPANQPTSQPASQPADSAAQAAQGEALLRQLSCVCFMASAPRFANCDSNFRLRFQVQRSKLPPPPPPFEAGGANSPISGEQETATLVGRAAIIFASWRRRGHQSASMRPNRAPMSLPVEARRKRAIGRPAGSRRGSPAAIAVSYWPSKVAAGATTGTRRSARVLGRACKPATGSTNLGAPPWTRLSPPKQTGFKLALPQAGSPWPKLASQMAELARRRTSWLRKWLALASGRARCGTVAAGNQARPLIVPECSPYLSLAQTRIIGPPGEQAEFRAANFGLELDANVCLASRDCFGPFFPQAAS